MKLSEVQYPATADLVYTDCRPDILSLIWWMGIAPAGQEEDFLHYSYIRDRESRTSEKWNGTVNFASWMRMSLKWNRHSYLKEWRGHQESIVLRGERNQINQIRVTSSEHIDQYGAPNSYETWQCNSSQDSTSYAFEWPVLHDELRSMMPDDRYRAIFDGMVNDRYQNEIAEELNCGTSLVTIIKKEITKLCSEKGWKHIQPNENKRRSGFVKSAGQKNIVGRSY